MEDRFNLVDEPWIPVAGVGRASLRQIFSNPEYRALGGNPVQKIALMKLLLAISQAACTPADDEEWMALGAQGLAERCLDYLGRWHGRFYLYGERPFLQMPAIAAAAVQSYGVVLPEVSTGNTTVLNQSQVECELEDADKALLLVGLMGFALSGKKTDNNVTLTPGYQGKRNDKGKQSSGKAGPAVAHFGLLHSFLTGSHISQTLWLNLLSIRQIERMGMFPQGVGVAPWEHMPEGEDCPVAGRLRESLMGRLVPMCRFCLLTEHGLHYSEGLAHSGYKEGVADPSVAIDYSGKEPKALWANPEKRPWRELTALLGLFSQQRSQGFQSWQLHAGLERIAKMDEVFAVWSAGLRVSNNAGEQYVSGTDDFVESQVWLHRDMLGGFWYSQLKAEMDGLDGLAKGIYGCIARYFKAQSTDGSSLAAQGSHLFWQLCERDFQALVDSCDQDEASIARRHRLRRGFAAYAHQAYDRFCPRETARQLDAWAKCQPNHNKYLKQEA